MMTLKIISQKENKKFSDHVGIFFTLKGFKLIQIKLIMPFYSTKFILFYFLMKIQCGHYFCTNCGNCTLHNIFWEDHDNQKTKIM